MPAGGKIDPDGRPPVAKGVGKTARRHDLEAPATPGLHGSDLQQGDVQMLEQGQQVAPRPKTQRPTGTVTQQPVTRQQPMNVPDPVSFAGSKLGGTLQRDGTSGQRLEVREFSRWQPLLERLASSPTASGILATAYIKRLSHLSKQPLGGSVAVLRQRDLDERLRQFNDGP